MCIGKQFRKNITFLSFNVENLKTKLEDSYFYKIFDKGDISILRNVESWHFKNQHWRIQESEVRPKHKHIIRHSGGITILARYSIVPGLKLVEDTQAEL